MAGLGAVLMSSASFASTNACQSTTASSIAAAGAQNSGAPIAAQGLPSPNADDFATLDGAATPGCSTLDLVFNNLTASSTAISFGSGGSAPRVTNAGAYLSLGPNQNLATGYVDAVFSTVRGADNVTSGGTDTFGDGDANDGTNNWVAPMKTNATFTVDYQVTTTDYIQFFGLNLNGLVMGVGGVVQGTINLCLGGSWNAGGTGATCSTGTVDTITLNSATNYSLDLGAKFTTIGVQNNFRLNGGSADGTNTYLTSFDESFNDDTPEPATFILMGSALVGVAALRLRKRKQA